jgi:hypothetical protein
LLPSIENVEPFVRIVFNAFRWSSTLVLGRSSGNVLDFTSAGFELYSAMELRIPTMSIRRSDLMSITIPA